MTLSWTERAKALMHTRGISQEDLAAALACSRGAVGHYLTGRRTPSLTQLERLAAALHTDPVWLLFGDSGGVLDQRAEYAPAGFVVTRAGNIGKGLRRRATEVLTLPADSEEGYAVLIDGNDYEPRIHAGEAVLINPAVPPAAGDEVLLQYRGRPGNTRLHSLLRVGRNDTITVDSIVGEKQVRKLTRRDYKLIHKVVAIFRPTTS